MTFVKMRKLSEIGTNTRELKKIPRLPLEFRGVTKLPQGQVDGAIPCGGSFKIIKAPC